MSFIGGSAINVRNADAGELRRPFDLRRDEFHRSPSQITGAVLGMHRGGGGMAMEAWLADSVINNGYGGSTIWTSVGIGSANFGATANGGPYCIFDQAAGDYMHIADSGWNEFSSNRFLVWRWVRLASSTGASQVVLSKWSDVTANRSWLLYWDNTASRFNFAVNGTGLAAANRIVASTHATGYGNYYLVAGFYQPSTRIDIFVAGADDIALTRDSNLVGIPASVYNGNARLEMGAYNVGASAHLNGRMGVGFSRGNIPAATVEEYITRIFHMTRWFYQA